MLTGINISCLDNVYLFYYKTFLLCALWKLGNQSLVFLSFICFVLWLCRGCVTPLRQMEFAGLRVGVTGRTLHPSLMNKTSRRGLGGKGRTVDPLLKDTVDSEAELSWGWCFCHFRDKRPSWIPAPVCYVCISLPYPSVLVRSGKKRQVQLACVTEKKTRHILV